MTAEKDRFRAQQKGVALGMAAALLISATAIAASLRVESGVVQPAALRLLAACRADSVIALFLFAAIANVARLRFFSATDIDGSGMTEATDDVRIANAVLQNTLEQTVLAVAAYLSIAAVLPRPGALLTTLAALFAVGRVCFWLGYGKGAAGRAFGFALTFYPSALTLILGLIVISTGWSLQG